MNANAQSIWYENPLFQDLTHEQLSHIQMLFREIHIEAGHSIAEEGDEATEIYIVKKGSVEVTKRAHETSIPHKISVINAGETIGEVALLDSARRSASLRATEPTTLLALEIDALKKYTHEEENAYQDIMPILDNLSKKMSIISEGRISAYSKIIFNLATHMSTRLHNTTQVTATALENQLQEYRMRVTMANFVVYVLIGITLYTFALQGLYLLDDVVTHTTMITVPIIIAFTLAFILMMKGSMYPLKTYGLTLKDWPKAVRNGLIYSLFLFFVAVASKWALITTIPEFSNQPLFVFMDNLRNPPEALMTELLLIFTYILFAPLQELIARGGLQSSLHEFLEGPHKKLLVILIPNLIFSMTHLHLSFSFAIAAFVPGLVWGWMYYHQRSLVGISLSHILVGLWNFYVVGFNSILL